VTGIFAFVPIDQATTVHTTIQPSVDGIQVIQAQFNDAAGNSDLTADCGANTWVLESLSWDVNTSTFNAAADEVFQIIVGGVTLATATNAQIQADQADILAAMEVGGITVIAGDDLVLRFTDGTGNELQQAIVTASLNTNSGAATCTIAGGLGL